jgi:ABC-2 type transport system ATP-binding protein
MVTSSDCQCAIALTEAANTLFSPILALHFEGQIEAQALLPEPSILIFDEPTSGLDPRGMVEVRDIIKDLRRTDVTILMSSHLLNEVQTVCDKVAIIDRGVLLTYDSVLNYDSVQNLSEGQEVTMNINTLEPVTPAEFTAIRSLKGVSLVKRVEALTLAVSFSGGPKRQSELLRAILDTTVSVVSYNVQHAAIEDLYLHLIPGRDTSHRVYTTA